MAWAPNFWPSDLVVSPFASVWVQVRVRVPLLRVPPRVMRMRLPVRVPPVCWLLQPWVWVPHLAPANASVLCLLKPWRLSLLSMAVRAVAAAAIRLRGIPNVLDA